MCGDAVTVSFWNHNNINLFKLYQWKNHCPMVQTGQNNYLS